MTAPRLAGAYADACAARDAATDGAPAWLRFLRQAARERLFALAPPDVRQEEWRFTNPAPLVNGRFADAFQDDPAAQGGAGGAPPATVPWTTIDLPLVDGHFAAAAARVPSLPAGAWVGGLGAALLERALAARIEDVLGSIAAWQERPFLALNTALTADGAFILAPAGTALPAPVRITYAGGAGAGKGGPRVRHPRALVVAEPGARLLVVEDFRAAQRPGDWVNAVLEIDVREGATVEHVALLPGKEGAFHTGAVFARVAEAGAFTTRSFALGGRITRRDLHVTFAGPGAQADLEGVFVTAGEDVVDHHTTVDHAVPGCTSRESFKGVLAGKSRGIFNGAVVIRPGAQKSDARQHNHNLLLSDDATVNSKPELQIYADDVKCGHGATVGELDPAALFYLRARGIGEAEARGLLTHAFVREIVDHIDHPGLRADVDAFVAARMQGLGGAR